jgi:hypothetical protein
MSAASAFLHYEVDSIPFHFLDISVEVNRRRKVMWKSHYEINEKASK